MASLENIKARNKASKQSNDVILVNNIQNKHRDLENALNVVEGVFQQHYYSSDFNDSLEAFERAANQELELLENIAKSIKI